MLMKDELSYFVLNIFFFFFFLKKIYLKFILFYFLNYITIHNSYNNLARLTA